MNTGIRRDLDITPHINEDNFIRLKISQQVTKLTSAATSTTPTTLKRTAKTTGSGQG